MTVMTTITAMTNYGSYDGHNSQSVTQDPNIDEINKVNTSTTWYHLYKVVHTYSRIIKYTIVPHLVLYLMH